MACVHEESIRMEFTRQTDSFADSPAMSAAETLDAVVEMISEALTRWRAPA
jgi:hypothetical protein